MTQVGDIHFEQVARRFGRRWALARVSATIPQGQGVMLTGPNGSGKSTLLRCLATALKLHQGQIRIGDKELWSHRWTLRRHMGFLSHAGYLYDDLSGQENLAVWARLGGIQGADYTALLERVGLPPNRRDPVRTYSAGMRRRLALARLMLQTPQIVLLDEPYTALDAQGRDLVTEVALQLREAGATVLLATHLVEHASPVCSRRLHLLDGRLERDESLGDR